MAERCGRHRRMDACELLLPRGSEVTPGGVVVLRVTAGQVLPRCAACAVVSQRAERLRSFEGTGQWSAGAPRNLAITGCAYVFEFSRPEMSSSLSDGEPQVAPGACAGRDALIGVSAVKQALQRARLDNLSRSRARALCFGAHLCRRCRPSSPRRASLGSGSVSRDLARSNRTAGRIPAAFRSVLLA